MHRRKLLATLAAFILTGCGGSGAENETPTAAGDTPVPSPNTTPGPSPEPTSSPSPTAERTLEPQPPTPEPTPTQPAEMTPTSTGLAPIHDQPTQTPQPVDGGGDFSQYDVSNLKTALGEHVNEARSDAGVSTVRTAGSLPDRLSKMAQEHSEDMARVRSATLEIDDVGPEERYDEHDINCAIADNNDRYNVDEEKLMLVAVTGESTAEKAATAVVDQWKRDIKTHRILTLKNTSYVGFGIAVINGNAYIALAYC